MIKIFSLIFFFIATFPVFAESSDFIAGFEDIPLMKGLAQTETESFAFGNEETRYIEVHLTSETVTSFEDVKAFYKETLKQFGWQITKDISNQLLFVREFDTLELNKIAILPLKISIILKNRI